MYVCMYVCILIAEGSSWHFLYFPIGLNSILPERLLQQSSQLYVYGISVVVTSAYKERTELFSLSQNLRKRALVSFFFIMYHYSLAQIYLTLQVFCFALFYILVLYVISWTYGSNLTTVETKILPVLNPYSTHLHLVPRSKNEWSCTFTPPIRFHVVVFS